MLRDPDRRCAGCCSTPDRPVQLVIAGKSHPHDDAGKALIQADRAVPPTDPAVRHRIAFLPGYDMQGWRDRCISGRDVWLNNPLRPLEACGTSGMKAALNGALNLSIRDGWWDEMAATAATAGPSPPPTASSDPNRRDELEAGALYELVEDQGSGRGSTSATPPMCQPGGWMEMVRHTLATLGPKVQATRMVAEYVERLYAPAAASSARLAADDYAGARELAGWRAAVLKQWPGVQVRHVESTGAGDTPVLGTTLTLRAEVDLAGLAHHRRRGSGRVGSGRCRWHAARDRGGTDGLRRRRRRPAPLRHRAGAVTQWGVRLHRPGRAPT